MFGKAPLTQFLGVEESEMKLEPSVKALEYQEGDRYLLCSDGVTDMLSDKEIETAMASGESVGDTVQILMDQVLEKGARDNTTIILCEIQRENHPLRAWLRQNKKENEGEVAAGPRRIHAARAPNVRNVLSLYGNRAQKAISVLLFARS